MIKIKTDIYKILSEIMDEKSMSIPDVARACGLSDSTVRGIITRKQKSVALEVAFRLSEGLNVTLERLNGVMSISNSDDTSHSPLEDKLLVNYKYLNDEGKERLVEIAEDMVAGGRYRPATERVWAAAMSTNNQGAGYIDMPSEDLDRVFNAPLTDEDL